MIFVRVELGAVRTGREYTIAATSRRDSHEQESSDPITFCFAGRDAPRPRAAL